MATERILDGKQSNKFSELIGAIDSGLSQGDRELKQPEGQFGFSAIIETENVRLTNEVLDFEYDVPFDDDLVPNEAELTLYNLKSETIANFKKGNELTLTCGYGSDLGIILHGKISKVTTKHDDLDKVTTVYVLDNFDYGDATIIEEAYSENVKASYILKSLLERVKLPIEVFKIQRDHTYENAVTIKGSITENIKTYADICGVSVWVSKQRIYCRPIWDGDNIHFTISAATGLIGSPDFFEEENTSEEYKDNVTGYNIEMLAQHRMTTAAIVAVESRDYKGLYRVCSGAHRYDGLSATTEIKCIENITTEIVQKESSSGTGSSGETGSASAVIDLVLGWAVKIASDDSYKYIWGGWGRSDGGYDCGHFVITAYEQAGVTLKSSGATYTGDLKSTALKIGFNDVTASCNLSTGSGLRRGDILLNESGRGTSGNGHAALVQKDGGTTVEARGSAVGIVANQSYRNYPWDCVLRYSKAESSPESSSAGNWVSGHTATTYGHTAEDDNGICGWNGLHYHDIPGCHVAIPTYCVKQANCYNSIWAHEDYPELANGYGVILEVKSVATGRITRAVVADCGNFGKHNKYNHNTALDLPPNTYGALGLSPGTHDVEYRVVGSIKSWGGEQV